MAHAFPMISAGGLFFMIMGVGVTLGGIWPRLRNLLLAMGGGIATVTITLTAASLSQPFGIPTFMQVAALGGSILLELILIAFVVKRYKHAGERTFFLAILLAVGIHFLPMALSFGWLCLALGAATMANAWFGLSMNRDIPLRTLWISDGVLKVAFGGFMFSLESLGRTAL
jgi:hypothetical protein